MIYSGRAAGSPGRGGAVQQFCLPHETDYFNVTLRPPGTITGHVVILFATEYDHEFRGNI